MICTENKLCPDANILAEFIEGKLLKKENKEYFLHIATCPKCKDLCQFAAKAVIRRKSRKNSNIPQNMKQHIQELIQNIGRNQAGNSEKWQKFTDYISKLFDVLEKSEVVAASETSTVIIFASDSDLNEEKWLAKLYIPAQLTEMLKITVETPTDLKISGQLILCGIPLEVVDGKAEISYQVLKEAFHNPEVAFCFRDQKKIPGHPEL